MPTICEYAKELLGINLFFLDFRARSNSTTPPAARYDVKGCVMSGSHSVLDPRDGVWRHAMDVGVGLDQRAETLWNLITEVRTVLYTCA